MKKTILAVAFLSVVCLSSKGNDLNHKYSSHFHHDDIVCPSPEELAIWIKTPDEYRKKRMLYLKAQKQKALLEYSEHIKDTELGNFLNSYPIDPFADQFIVPPHYYELWVYLQNLKYDHKYIISAIREDEAIFMVDSKGCVAPHAPSLYVAMADYSKPSENDIERWLKKDPRTEVRQKVLWESFSFNQYPNSFYCRICPYIMINDSDSTIRSWAAHILRTSETGTEILKQFILRDDIPDYMKPTLDAIINQPSQFSPHGEITAKRVDPQAIFSDVEIILTDKGETNSMIQIKNGQLEEN